MKEKIMEIVVYVAPLIAGFITSILIPLLVEKFCKKILKEKVDKIDSSKEIKEVKEELKEIKREILEMRGKIK